MYIVLLMKTGPPLSLPLHHDDVLTVLHNRKTQEFVYKNVKVTFRRGSHFILILTKKGSLSHNKSGISNYSAS